MIVIDYGDTQDRVLKNFTEGLKGFTENILSDAVLVLLVKAIGDPANIIIPFLPKNTPLMFRYQADF